MRFRKGAASLVCEFVEGRSVLSRVSHRAPGRLLPLRTAAAFEARAARCVLSNYGGGLLSGDEVDFDVTVKEGAALHVSSQSPTKIYKGPVGARQRVSATVEPGALLTLGFDGVTPFRASSYDQRQRIDLADETASAVVVDWVAAGRSANGERWSFDRLATRSEYFVHGRGDDHATRRNPALVDALSLQGKGTTTSLVNDVDSASERYDAVVTVVTVGPRAAAVARRLEEVACALASRRGARVIRGAALDLDETCRLDGAALMGVSASHETTHGFAVARLLAERADDAYRILHASLAPLREDFGEVPYAERIHAIGGWAAASSSKDTAAAIESRQKSSRKDDAEAPPPPPPPPQRVGGRRPEAASPPPLTSSSELFVFAQLVDSALPTGSFAHSGSVEAAFQLGVLKAGDDAALAAYLGALVRSHGCLAAPFFREAWDQAANSAALRALDGALGALLVPNAPAKRASEAHAAALNRLKETLLRVPEESPPGGAGAGPREEEEGAPLFSNKNHPHRTVAPYDARQGAVSLGALSRALGLPRHAAQDAFAFAVARDAVSAAVRLGITGPNRAQRLLLDCLRGLRLPEVDVKDAATTSPLVETTHAAHDLLEMRLFRT